MNITHIIGFILIGEMDYTLISDVGNQLFITTFVPIIIHVILLFPISIICLMKYSGINRLMHNAFLKEV